MVDQRCDRRRHAGGLTHGTALPPDGSLDDPVEFIVQMDGE